ncbi:UNVERIFIED_CONTAM: Serine/threonine-protein kinase-like protein [Sesamum radiatum]|uniref:Serine/threonine-protein kinase-like protein n=1 Tax=Sesamum radiatum TaxID=300843 RepID=A0AAW2KLI0_SESRA
MASPPPISSEKAAMAPSIKLTSTRLNSLPPSKSKLNHPTTANPADNEVEILSRVYHPRLVNLLGFAIDPNQRKLIVVEYMPNGSLYDLLHGSAKPPGWVKRTRDFGLALRGHVEDVKVKSTPPAGTLGYLDPGYLAPGDLSTKSDVFSFGILMLEIISGRNAIDVNYSPPSVVEWAVPEIKSGNITGICDPRIGPPEDSEALRLMAVLAARLGRRVGRVVQDSRMVKYEALDESVELVRNARTGSRRNGKVSSAAGVDVRSDVIGDRVGRSKSIGTASEIKYLPTDLSNDHMNRRRAGFSVKMPTVRLRKSKSMGFCRA